MSDVILEVKGLTKHFLVNKRKNTMVHAVDNVSFAIKEGQTMGLVGESGCGKSTCARTIIRIYEPTSGQIIFNSQDISQLPQRDLKLLRKNIQMIFQDPYSSLNPRMNVRQIISEPLKAHNIGGSRSERNELVSNILRMVGLGDEHATRYPHEFSGGQRQRIGVARALVLNPSVVICDEPISALDVSIQAQVINLLKELQSNLNITYLFIAHDLSMVRYVSDTVGVMYLGQLVELCESKEIYSNPCHPYTIGLLKSVPVRSPKLARQKEESGIEGDIPSPITPPSGCRFRTRCKQVMPVCSEISPPLLDIGGGHSVACHLYK